MCVHDNKQNCSGLTVELWDSDSTRGAGFGQTREGPWKQTTVMVADIFRIWLFPLFFRVHGGQSFAEIEKYGEKPLQHIPRQADQGQRQGGFSI